MAEPTTFLVGARVRIKDVDQAFGGRVGVVSRPADPKRPTWRLVALDAQEGLFKQDVIVPVDLLEASS